MLNEPLREIIREHEFEEQLIALLVNAEEADEFTNAAEILLAENPLVGVPVAEFEGATIWQLSMAPVRGWSVALYYTFDEKTVTFLSILATDN